MKKRPRDTQWYLPESARKAFRTVMLVCVFASQWQAPLPWVHCHTESASQEKVQHLDRHLAAWHSDAPARGWHLHFAMLDDILRGGGCPVPPKKGDEPSTQDRVLLIDQVAGSSRVVPVPTEAAFGQHDVCTKFTACLCRSASRRQFLGDHAESQRLQKMLCIAQC